MIETLLMFILTLLARISIGELSKNYEFFVSWIQPVNIIMYCCLGLFVMFVLIAIVKRCLK